MRQYEKEQAKIEQLERPRRRSCACGPFMGNDALHKRAIVDGKAHRADAHDGQAQRGSGR